jgi:hypothetical protein
VKIWTAWKHWRLHVFCEQICDSGVAKVSVRDPQWLAVAPLPLGLFQEIDGW